MKLKAMATLASVALAGCTTTANGETGVTQDQLDGTKWTILSIDGSAPKSEKARGEFTGGRVGFSAGCNGIGGNYRLNGDQLEGGPYVSTQMFCDGLMEQERALSQLLEEKPRLTLSGDRLLLQSANHSAELQRSAS